MPDEAQPTRKARGRPQGSRNRSTLAKIEMIREAEAEARVTLSASEIEKMGPLQVMDYAMKFHLRAGSLTVAADIAKNLAAAIDRRERPALLDAPEDRRTALVTSIGNDAPPERIDRGKRSDGTMPPVAFN